MKKRLTVITLIMLFCSTMFGQTPTHPWGPTIGGYANVGIVYGKVSIHGTEQAYNENNKIVVGAFCGKELRAVSELDPNLDMFLLTVSGLSNDLITFAVYNPAEQEVLYSDNSVKLKNDNAEQKNLNFLYHWNHADFDFRDFSGYMTFADSYITKDGEIIESNLFTNNSVELVALCRDELRSLLIDNKNYIAVAGNTDNEEIVFQLYDHSSNKLFDAEQTFKYTTDGMLSKQYINFIGEKIFKVTDQDNHSQYYAELANALENSADNTIVLIRDAQGPGVIIDKDATIDFEGFTYSFTEPAVGSNGTETNGFQILPGNTVTLRNGTLQVAESYYDKYAILVQNYAKRLDLEGMTLNGAGLNRSDLSYVLSNNSGEINLTNTTINANTAEGTHFAFDACKFANYSVPGVMIRENVIINGKAELTGGNIFGNTKEGLEIVASKSFEAAPGEGTIGWGTISTPISGGSLIDESLPATDADNPHDLYLYHEPTGMWHYYKEYPGGGATNGFDSFETGHGYLYANKTDMTAKFEGKMNYETASMDVTYTEEAGYFKGFNLIGNPFASYITLNDIEPTSGDIEIAGGFYSIDAETGGYIAKNPTDKISAMEAVMIQIVPVESQVRMNRFKSELVFTQPNPTTAKRSETVNASLAISVSNDNYSDIAYVSFSEGIGLNKIEHLNNDVPMVYLPVDGADYAVATMSQDVTVFPVSFKAATMGEYTISVEAQNCEYSTMTLVDRLTGVETNLLVEDYSFIAKANDNVDRFFIRLDNNQQTTDNGHFAYINNGMINFDVEGQAVVNVYDVTGRSVAEYNVTESASISISEFTSGMYIIRMSDENGVKVQKIVVE